MSPNDTPVLVAPNGKPARQALDTRCPRCGATESTRVASCGFGTPVPLCGLCGWAFVGEVWRG